MRFIIVEKFELQCNESVTYRNKEKELNHKRFIDNQYID